ncbi:uncharacterized protein [Littorina saxatilis]|uniref:KY-like immunoglobulin-like domain-containing protein n=1 Tax=Littorina saxatilis TaxID=31220 RepID=A0AAN9BSD5_9CAEN
MSAGRPAIPEGIGQKPEFQELGLQLKSHTSAEISTEDNIFDIKIKSPKCALKTTFKLLQYKNGNEKEVPEGVFTQMKDDDVVFHLALPEPAWYKLNIFATKLDAAGSTLPNVFTYMIDLKRAKEAVKPYPKAYADFAKGCYLHKPLFLDTTKDLSKVHFKVEVKDAKRVAVKAGDEWFQLTKQGGDLWEGDVNLQPYRGKGVPVNLNASIGSDETQFATLLQYTV